MIRSGPAIAAAVRACRRAREARAEAGAPWPPPPDEPGAWLDIDPFIDAQLGPNSYDVTLHPRLLTYRLRTGEFLDPDQDNPTTVQDIPPEGTILVPGTVYLGSTVERTACVRYVPWLDGRSSLGRLGVSLHCTAGRGDDGFGEARPGGCPWTLEITVTHPVRLRAGMRVGQLTFFEMRGARRPYRGRYADQDGAVPSRLWRDNLPG